MKPCPNGTVIDGCPFPVEPRRKNHLVTPWGYILHDSVQGLVDINTIALLRQLISVMQDIIPDESQTGSGRFLFIGNEIPSRNG